MSPREAGVSLVEARIGRLSPGGGGKDGATRRSLYMRVYVSKRSDATIHVPRSWLDRDVFNNPKCIVYASKVLNQRQPVYPLRIRPWSRSRAQLESGAEEA